MALTFAILMTALSSNAVFAASNEVTSKTVSTWSVSGDETDVVNENVSTEPPKEPGITVFGTTPPTSFMNVKGGKLTFSGTAKSSILYTNKGFYGAKNVLISITNLSTTKDLKVALCKAGGTTVLSWSIPKNSGMGKSVLNLSIGTNYYLKFYAPSNFKGYVSA